MWKTVKLGDVFDFKNGRSFGKEEWSDSGLPIIRIQNLNDENASFNHFNGDYDKAIEVNSGDLLFSWSGTVGSSFGPHIWNRAAGVLNQHIFKLSFKQNVNTKYAFYCLKNITKLIEQSVVGAVGLVHVTKKSLVEFTIPLPPLAEQQRIVEKLDRAFEEIDRAIEAAERKQEEVLTLKAAVLSQELNSSELDRTVKLGEFAEFENGDRGKNYPSKQHQIEEGIPFINAGDLKNDGSISSLGMAYISEERFKLLGAGKIKTNDVLFCLRGSLGKCAINTEFERGAIASSLVILRPNINMIMPQYLLHLLKSDVTKKHIEETAGGAAQPNLSAKTVSNYEYLLPSLREQQKIVEKLDQVFMSADEALAALSNQLDQYKQLKSAILAQELKGPES